jgi:hypothetical protein
MISNAVKANLSGTLPSPPRPLEDALEEVDREQDEDDDDQDGDDAHWSPSGREFGSAR